MVEVKFPVSFINIFYDGLTSFGTFLWSSTLTSIITINPDRVSVILSLPPLAHKKGLQSFLGRINFVRRFIIDITNLLKPLTSMLKKNVPVSWSKDGKRSFEMIKEALATAPTLLNPYFSKDFILYAYDNIDSISAMLV